MAKVKLYMSLFLHQTTTYNLSRQPGRRLYMSLFLHQTTTNLPLPNMVCWLYMSLFLHQTTTITKQHRHNQQLYMSLFLHQTTTCARCPLSYTSCICLYSYIKPQLKLYTSFNLKVVYVSIPTSNHNYRELRIRLLLVVYVSIPTSNHNTFAVLYILCQLYMSLFLHQTTTGSRR